MATITKSELGIELAVTKGRISQYLREGMPALGDGRLDRDEALNWLAKNNLGTACDRARALLRGEATERKTTKSNPKRKSAAPPTPPGFAVLDLIDARTDRMAVLALLVALTQIGAKASIAAHAAGAERSIAERTGQIMTALFANFIEGYVGDLGILDPKDLAFPHPRNFDQVAWDKFGGPGAMALPHDKE
ncbi:MAG: hypothetical protein FD148_793 [Methylocystaceae bacterium]|nr:MAG: hypothetical protein FD148_793 [Methylocystaceae bacterium]